VQRALRRRDGQALVEFAILVPVLIVLLLGIVDIARMTGDYLVVLHGTREGVRVAITGARESEIRSRVETVTETLDRDRLSVDVSPAGGTAESGRDVEVSVVYRYQVMAITWLIGGEVPLTGRLRGRVE
jgi:Flp pilus assembly protein TadG